MFNDNSSINMKERLLITVKTLPARIGVVIPAVILGIGARLHPDIQERLINHEYEITSKYGSKSLYVGLSSMFLPQEGRMRVRKAANQGLEEYRQRYVDQMIQSMKHELQGGQNG